MYRSKILVSYSRDYGPRFRAPSDADITTLFTRLHRRGRRRLVRRGRLPEDDAGSDSFAAQAPLFAQTVSASLQGRVALGPRAGRDVHQRRRLGVQRGLLISHSLSYQPTAPASSLFGGRFVHGL